MSAPAKPTYQQLVTAALGDYKKQSAQAIVKEVAAKRGEADQNKCRHFVKLTLKRMVEKKLITQVKGQGATGSFKLIKQNDQVICQYNTDRPFHTRWRLDRHTFFPSSLVDACYSLTLFELFFKYLISRTTRVL